jgi:hypothetical protein
LSYIGTVQDGSILQNHQTHHRGNHHHQQDYIETRTPHPHNKRAMQKQRNHMSSKMENSAKGECNKLHNQMSHRTPHVEYNLKRPTTKQSTKTATTEISHNNPINKQHKKKKEKQQKRRIPQPNLATSKRKTLSNGTTYSSKHITWPLTLH